MFNRIPDVIPVDLDLSSADMEDADGCQAAAKAFLKALSAFEQSGRWTGGTFDLADLYSPEPEPSTVIKVTLSYALASHPSDGGL